MAISTYKTFLMDSEDGESWNKLVDIKDFPDLGGAPEMLDATTLSDRMRRYVKGIQETEALEFGANYDPTDFKAIKALEGKDTHYAVWFGGTEQGATVTPTGSLGKFSFKGDISVFPNGLEVNGVRQMTITITPSTIIDFGDGE